MIILSYDRNKNILKVFLMSGKNVHDKILSEINKTNYCNSIHLINIHLDIN